MRIRVSLGSPLSSKKSNVRLRMDTLAARPSGLHAFFLGGVPKSAKANLAAGLCLCQDRVFHDPRGREGPPPLEAAPVARSSGPEKTLEILAPCDLAHVTRVFTLDAGAGGLGGATQGVQATSGERSRIHFGGASGGSGQGIRTARSPTLPKANRGSNALEGATQ